jgi:hypothetical protein
MVSALDVARSLEYLAEFSMSVVLEHGGDVFRRVGLPREKALSNMLKFASDFMNPVVSQLDPSDLHRAASSLRIASDYGERLVRLRAEDANEKADETARLRELPQKLVRDYPSHRFVISANEAETLGLNVIPLASYGLCAEAYLLYDVFTEGQRSVVFLARKDAMRIPRQEEVVADVGGQGAEEEPGDRGGSGVECEAEPGS